jgi:reverse gyrase
VEQGSKYISSKEKNAQVANDFYKFQIKETKKTELEELRKGFEEDRRRLAKMLMKRQEKEKKAARATAE